MGPLDEYMSIFETGDARMRAPTTDRTSEMDLNVEMPELPGYLEGLVVQAPQYRQATAAVAPVVPTVYGTPTTRATRSVARGTPGKQRVTARAPSPLFAINTNVPAARTAESSSSSTSPSAGAPPPSPPDAMPPPPDAPPDSPSLSVKSGGALVTSSSTVAPAATGGGSVGGLVLAAAAIGGLWWFFYRRDADDRRPARGVKGLKGEHEVHELELYMDNTQAVYAQRKPFQENAARRMRKGTYDPSKAPKLWLYYVERGIAAYNKEHGRGSMRLTRDEKMTLAQRYAREWEEEARAAR